MYVCIREMLLQTRRATYHGTRVKLSFTTSDGVYEKWMCTFWFNPWIITSHKYVVVEQVVESIEEENLANQIMDFVYFLPNLIDLMIS